ncbi:unnamed protein product [Malus baccata var. baccata]
MNMNSPFEAQGIAQANNPYVHYSPVPATSNSSTKHYQCGKRVEVATIRAEAMADNVWNHSRMCPSFTEAVKARLNTGTKVLTAGGQEKVFQQTFERITGEKLLHSYACYLSTSHGPVIGMLYISNLRTVNPSANIWNPSEKYIHIVTRDGHDFWFMGFISYDKALAFLFQAPESLNYQMFIRYLMLGIYITHLADFLTNMESKVSIASKHTEIPDEPRV